MISCRLEYKPFTLQKPDRLCASQMTLVCHWCVLCAELALTAFVADLRPPHIHDVMRIAQFSTKLVLAKASYNGLTAGLHDWSIDDYADLTHGAASLGGVFNGSGEYKKPDDFVSSLLFPGQIHLLSLS